MGIAFTITLMLTVWDTSHGIELERVQMQRTLTSFGNPTADLARGIELCRIQGVLRAKQMSAAWARKGYEWASTNVDCDWAVGEAL